MEVGTAASADHDHNHNTTPPSQPPPSVPGAGRALLWLLAFMAVYFLAVVVYFAGYGAVLGASNPEIVADPQFQGLLDEHLTSLGAFIGIYCTQFALLMPLVLFASHFKHQPWRETLAFNRVSGKTVATWVGLLGVFLAVESLLNLLLPIEPGAFLETISDTDNLPLALVLVLLAPVLEEMIFRGYLYKAWRTTRLGASGTILITSAIFALIHMGQYHWVFTVYLFVFALLLGAAREKTGSLWVPIIMHAINNLLAAILVVYLGFL